MCATQQCSRETRAAEVTVWYIGPTRCVTQIILMLFIGSF